ncbi:hypothetical protein GCM10010987_25330 [Bradyrhizobium guangdongense]|uniref:Uncharacterized protein n=1 Tax=Bradyrhizobium guangdongense TaxID=1325090 RepID=A0AA87W2Z3_9BRAD|nr:hypothetical protein GCM10010987_25330 [Bradyrhizobium guangdongense]
MELRHFTQKKAQPIIAASNLKWKVDPRHRFAWPKASIMIANDRALMEAPYQTWLAEDLQREKGRARMHPKC